ncbi:MAG TPA: hypothetical protein VLI92_01455 [Candidatus Saccharimonadales bacterium]|nr:hypothetical protein [Candidatus Saccharimonadales bacterium]
MKYFYEEITEIHEIPELIKSSTDNADEQEQLLEIVRSTIHHKVLDLIFRELDVVQQQEFLEYIETADNQSSVIDKLKEWISDVEQKILLKVKQAEQEIIEAIKEENQM